MRLAIMQPYFFPYLGYWQLINAVDRFVIYDDVNYIKNSWINRNRILVNGKATYVTIPLDHASPFNPICVTLMQKGAVWRTKLNKMICNTYRRAPHFHEVWPVIEKIIEYATDNLADYLAHQLRTLSLFMGIDTELVSSSRGYGNADLHGQQRIIDICQREAASMYINPEGGSALYDAKEFRDAGIELRFLKMHPLSYSQRGATFTPCLSIVDVLMEVGVNEVMWYLKLYELLSAE